MNIEQEWNRYKKACYPNGCHSVQEIETRQAFYAGLLVAFNAVKELSEVEPEEEAMRQMAMLEKMITESNRQNVQRAKGGN